MRASLSGSIKQLMLAQCGSGLILGVDNSISSIAKLACKER